MQKNILETFLEHQQAYHVITPEGGVPALLTDNGKKILDLEALLPAPLQIKFERTFDDLRGFVDYVNQFKTPQTVCFASKKQITSIIDFHEASSPAWHKHQVSYNIQPSERWKIWERAHNSWMGQRDFADFLDTGLNEIVKPTESEILTLVKNFRATVNQEVEAQDSAAGTSFSYRKVVKGGGLTEIEVPEFITVALQPFQGLSVLNSRIEDKEKHIPLYNLRAKINWRVSPNCGDENNSLQFKVQILNLERAVEETIEQLRAAIASLTNVKTFIG